MIKIQRTSSVAIILINYKTIEETIECVKSLENLSYSNFKIYCLDNNSEDDSYELLTKELTQFKDSLNIELIASNSNLGFAGGNNLLIKKAIFEEGFDFIWLLNNDTTVDKNALSASVEIAEEDNKIGIIGSKIYYYSNPDILWFAGGTIDKLGNPLHIGKNEKDIGKYNSLKEVEFITGCSMLVSAKFIKTIGVMEESYFMYYEDVDWCIRGENNNFKLVYNPKSIVYHKVASSSKKNNKEKRPHNDYYETRNSILYIMKCYKGYKKILPFFIGVPYRLFKKILRIILFDKTHKKEKLLSVSKAILHIISGKTGIYIR